MFLGEIIHLRTALRRNRLVCTVVVPGGGKVTKRSFRGPVGSSVAILALAVCLKIAILGFAWQLFRKCWAKGHATTESLSAQRSNAATRPSASRDHLQRRDQRMREGHATT